MVDNLTVRSWLKTAYYTGQDAKRAIRDAADAGYKAYQKRDAEISRKDRIFFKTYAAEKKGYTKVGLYKPNSKQLEWAVKRAKRDDLEAFYITVEDYIVLFTKRAKAQKITRIKKAVSNKKVSPRRKSVATRININSKVIPVSSWYIRGMKIMRGLPVTQVFSNEKYTLQERFETDSEWDIAKDEARDFQKRGWKVKLVLMENLDRDERLALYTRKS